MQNGSPKTLNTQKIGEDEKYLVGMYDVEILTIPRIYVTTRVDQSSTSNIDIKAPGFVKYSSGNPITGQIFEKNDNGTWDWVANLEDGSKSGIQQLQPGAYRIVYRQINLKKSEYTLEKDFRINSNRTITIQL